MCCARSLAASPILVTVKTVHATSPISTTIHPVITKRNSTRSSIGNSGGDGDPGEEAPVCQTEANSARMMNIKDLWRFGLMKDRQEDIHAYDRVAVAGKERIIHGFQFVRPSLPFAS